MSKRIDKFTQYKNRETNQYQTDRPFTVYIDMDGVITDFEQDFIDIKANKEGLSYDVYDKKYGFPSSWQLIDAQGLTWWADMSWKPDGKELWNYMAKYDPTVLSAPSRHPNSSRGKVIWVNRELNFDVKSATRSPKNAKWDVDSKMILCAQKYLFTKRYSNSILIDDTKKKIDDWRGNGGIGILHRDTESTIVEFERITSKL